MFGLMRVGGCGRKTEARYERARAYCGTCKTMGRLYGQPSRVLLNHDAVFLGELLLALSPKPDWAPAYTPRRCASLPKGSQIPPALAYAATANVALAEFAVRDKIADASKVWHGARLALSRPFARARGRLAAWNVPTAELFALQTRQAEVEAERGRALEFYAAPTGDATRLIFAHGGAVVAPEQTGNLGALGEAFGRLVFVLDALTDVRDDAKVGAFNAVEASGGDSAGAKGCARQLLSDALSALNALPLEGERRAFFAGRLRTSVAMALGGALAMDGGIDSGEAASEVVQKARRGFGNCCGISDDDLCDCFCDDCLCDCCCDNAGCCDSCNCCDGCDCNCN